MFTKLGRSFLPLAAGLCALALASGCPRAKAPAPQTDFALPPHLAGTVQEFAGLVGTGEVPVSGYGIVVGLGTTGSRTVPPGLKDYLVKYLLKEGLGSWRQGTQAVSPEAFLADPDTAVVLLAGSVPAWAPKGTRFDVFLTALPGTQVQSLAGGMLIPADLGLAITPVARPGSGPPWARAAGAVFVNPFLDPTRPGELAKLQSARVVGGGLLMQTRPMVLRLRQPDRPRCLLIERRINERFLNPRGNSPAKATGPSTIELGVPEDFVGDEGSFLQLVMSLPLQSLSSAVETRIRQLAEAMKLPGSPHEEMGLVLEAIGRQAVPSLQTLYASPTPAAAFYAARAGLRLGDEPAGDVILRFAAGSDASFRVPAIEEIGRHRSLTAAVPILRRLIDDPSELVRVAAYEALDRHGDQETIRTVDVSGAFRLDLVKTTRDYVLYATQTKEPRIVLFGPEARVIRPVFFASADDLVTLNARGDDEKLAIFRKVARGGQYSDVLHIDFLVETLIRTMGSKPEKDPFGSFTGLGLTYGQVVSVLYPLCRRGDIPAKFVLQPLPEVQRLYGPSPPQSRPDAPPS